MSLYAASKKANELIAHTYNHLMAPTGLKFSQSMDPGVDQIWPMLLLDDLADEPIKMFNHGLMQRDFTYIDDIVEGVRVAVQNRCNAIRCSRPAASFLLIGFNIGNARLSSCVLLS